MRFWRPPLYQLELLACNPLYLPSGPPSGSLRYTAFGGLLTTLRSPHGVLFRFAVRCMVPAPPAKFLGLETFCVLLLVLRHRVVSFFAVATLQGNDVSHKTPFCSRYSMISATVPAPTVRPPSRMANRSPFSSATGVISVISSDTLSPGITISTPAGSSADPVTSVVRK
jgi:hypothetical protein